MKEVTVTYTAEFFDTFEVEDDWEWDGTLKAILEHTDMPYQGGDLMDWEIR